MQEREVNRMEVAKPGCAASRVGREPGRAVSRLGSRGGRRVRPAAPNSGHGMPQGGASLIELLVGLGLIAVVVLPMLATVATSGIVADRFASSGEDLILARSQLESIMRQQYQRAAGTPTPYATVAPFSGFDITISRTGIITYTYATPISPTPTLAPAPETLQTITVTIRFPTGEYQLGTIKADRKLR